MKPILEYLLSKDKSRVPGIDEYGEWLVLVPFGLDYEEMKNDFNDCLVVDNRSANPNIFVLHADDALDFMKSKQDSSTTVCKVPDKYASIEEFIEDYEEGEIWISELEEIQ